MFLLQPRCTVEQRPTECDLCIFRAVAVHHFSIDDLNESGCKTSENWLEYVEQYKSLFLDNTSLTLGERATDKR